MPWWPISPRDLVIRGLDPRIHQASHESLEEDGLPGQSPAMTGFLVYAPKLFGEPATGRLPPDSTRMTARPRSLVPSARKRNRPSMPAKPDGLVSTSGEKRWPPWVRASAATSATASYASVAVRTGSAPYFAR